MDLAPISNLRACKPTSAEDAAKSDEAPSSVLRGLAKPKLREPAARYWHDWVSFQTFFFLPLGCVTSTGVVWYEQ